HLDIAALDTRYRTGVADAVRGVSSNNRRSPPHSAYTECTAMGRRALLHVAVARVPPDFRGGSKPRDRHVLRRPDFRRVCDATTDVDLGACAAGSGIRNRIHSLPARSERLSNVGPASARGSAWPRWERQQDFGSKNGTAFRSRSCCGARVSFFTLRSDWNSGSGTTAPKSYLH